MAKISSSRSSSVRPQDREDPILLAAAHHQPPHFQDILEGSDDRSPREYLPLKPHLPVELRLIQAIEAARGTSERTLDNTASMLELHEANLNKIVAEKIAKIHEACNRSQAAEFWETVRNIGAAILGAVSTFLGLSLFAAGAPTVIGAALIASGVLTLANLAFTDAGLWEWLAEKLVSDEKNRNRIAAAIPVVIGLLACGAGLASIGAFAMWGALPVAPQAMTIIQLAGNMLTIGGSAMKQFSQARLTLSKADLQALQHKLGKHQHDVDQLSDDVEEILKGQGEMHKRARSIIDLSIRTNREILA